MACSNLSAYLSVCLFCMHPHMHACMSTGLACHRHLREGQADRAADANAARFSCGLACLHCPRRRLRLSCGYWVKVLGNGLGSRVKRSGLMWALPSAWPWPSPLCCTCISDTDCMAELRPAFLTARVNRLEVVPVRRVNRLEVLSFFSRYNKIGRVYQDGEIRTVPHMHEPWHE